MATIQSHSTMFLLMHFVHLQANSKHVKHALINLIFKGYFIVKCSIYNKTTCLVDTSNNVC